MSRRLPVTGETNRSVHLPRPFAEPGSNLSPGIVPSETGLAPAWSFLAFKSEIMFGPTFSPTWSVRFCEAIIHELRQKSSISLIYWLFFASMRRPDTV